MTSWLDEVLAITPMRFESDSDESLLGSVTGTTWTTLHSFSSEVFVDAGKTIFASVSLHGTASTDAGKLRIVYQINGGAAQQLGAALINVDEGIYSTVSPFLIQGYQTLSAGGTVTFAIQGQGTAAGATMYLFSPYCARIEILNEVET